MKSKILSSLVFSLMLVPVAEKQAFSANLNCKQILIILRGEKAEKLVCEQQILETTPNENLTIISYAQGKIGNSPKRKTSPVSEGFSSVIAELNCSDPKGCFEDNPRGPMTNRNIPHIITPSNIKLLNTKPSLSWYAVKGARVYLVRLIKITGTETIRETEIDALQFTENIISIDYPFEKPLEPGNSYKLIIEVKMAAHQPITPGEATFEILTEKQMQEFNPKAKK